MTADYDPPTDINPYDSIDEILTSARLRLRARLDHTHRLARLHPDPQWMRRIQIHSHRLQRQIRRRQTVEMLIDAACAHAGVLLPDLAPRRGRSPLPHPLPRRRPKPLELLDAVTHRQDHGYVYVNSCKLCYQREYQYYTNNPDKKPKRPWWKRGEHGEFGDFPGGMKEKLRAEYGFGDFQQRAPRKNPPSR